MVWINRYEHTPTHTPNTQLKQSSYLQNFGWLYFYILYVLWYKDLELFIWKLRPVHTKMISAYSFCRDLLLTSFHPSWALVSNHKMNHIPSYHFFLGRRFSRIGTVIVLSGQMSWHIILICRIILISKKKGISKKTTLIWKACLKFEPFGIQFSWVGCCHSNSPAY